MTFHVTIQDADGARRSFARAAASRAELLKALRAERALVLAVEEAAEAPRALPPAWHPAWLRPMTGFDVEMGFRQLAAMLRSGITLLDGLATVADQALSPRAKRTWLGVKEAIFRGGTFAEALADARGRFDGMSVRLVEVGERSGELARVVTRAADQLEQRRNLRAQVVNALAYPLLAILMAVGVSVFLVVSVIPKIAAFLQAGGAQLPAMTQSLVDLSAWVEAHGLQLLAGLGAAAAAWIVVRLNAAGREAQDVFLMRLPVTGKILRLAGTALFARSMEIMLASGVTLLEALGTAARLLANRRLRRRVATAGEEVARGASLAAALAPAREFMPMLVRMASVGETSGALPETFAETAAFHEMMLARAVRRFGMLIEPVMIVVTGLIVGYVYVAFFMAIFAMAGTNG